MHLGTFVLVHGHRLQWVQEGVTPFCMVFGVTLWNF